MKCRVCGAESGKYPLCRACNAKKEKGIIIKCPRCDDWHYATVTCKPKVVTPTQSNEFAYSLKKSLITKSEENYYSAILGVLPTGYHVFPQINLASFIDKTENSRFHTELFRNVDFLITDQDYSPKIVVEINDMTHMTNERRDRDEKVQKICEEAGIHILKLWTSYGVKPEYIKEKITTLLSTTPQRIHHFQDVKPAKETSPSAQAKSDEQSFNTFKPAVPSYSQPSKKAGCYVATCVYGSYDCPQVWILRRFRDDILANTWYGRLFIRSYYKISPSIVKCFGKQEWFHKVFRTILNKMTEKLHNKGFSDSPYYDR